MAPNCPTESAGAPASLDVASTVKVRASASYTARSMVTWSTTLMVLVEAGLSDTLRTVIVAPSAGGGLGMAMRAKYRPPSPRRVIVGVSRLEFARTWMTCPLSLLARTSRKPLPAPSVEYVADCTSRPELVARRPCSENCRVSPMVCQLPSGPSRSTRTKLVP